MYPPEALVQDCPIPESALLTNEDLALWAKALKDGLIDCNVDKAALREWIKTYKAKEKK